MLIENITENYFIRIGDNVQRQAPGLNYCLILFDNKENSEARILSNVNLENVVNVFNGILIEIKRNTPENKLNKTSNMPAGNKKRNLF